MIGVELVDTRTYADWGEQYNRKGRRAEVQADISGSREKLRAGSAARADDSPARRQSRRTLALRDVLFQKGGTRTKKSARLLPQAIAIDPITRCLWAWGELRSLSSTVSWIRRSTMPKVEAAVRKALELDDTLAEAHAALGNFLRESWDWAGAEREYQRAIALNPSLALAHRNYGGFLANMGRHDQALAEVTRAREFDPLNSFATTIIGYRLFHARRYDEAIETLKPEINKDWPHAHDHGYSYAAKGMYKEAIAAYGLAIERDDTPSNQIYLGAAYAGAGDHQRAQAILKRLESGERYVSPGELAVLYAALGEREQAFKSLEKGFAARDLQLQFLGIDPAFDSLRDDPRFADLMRRVGLPSVAGNPK